MKYQIVRDNNCGAVEAYSRGVRSKCRTCGKKINLKECFVLKETDSAQEAGYLMRQVKIELARQEIYHFRTQK